MSGTWTRIQLVGKNVDIFTPAARPRFGILYLHSGALESLAEQPLATELLDRMGLACIAPHAGLSWWTNRICPVFDANITCEQFLLENVLPLFQEHWQIAPKRIGILGISMGGQGGMKLAFRHANLFSAVAGIASAFDCFEKFDDGVNLDLIYDSKEECRQDTALMHIPVDPPPHIFFCCDPNDLWHRGNDRMHEKLNALGIAHTCDLDTEAGGHSWQYFFAKAEPALRFLVEGLVQESRRIL